MHVYTHITIYVYIYIYNAIILYYHIIVYYVLLYIDIYIYIYIYTYVYTYIHTLVYQQDATTGTDCVIIALDVDEAGKGRGGTTDREESISISVIVYIITYIHLFYLYYYIHTSMMSWSFSLLGGLRTAADRSDASRFPRSSRHPIRRLYFVYGVDIWLFFSLFVFVAKKSSRSDMKRPSAVYGCELSCPSQAVHFTIEMRVCDASRALLFLRRLREGRLRLRAQ